MDEKWYKGSDVKLLIGITGTGFDIDANGWSVDVYIDKKLATTIDKTDAISDGEGKYYLCISQDLLPKTGTMYLVVHAAVPDNDFDDGFRDEVEKVKVGEYNKIF